MDIFSPSFLTEYLYDEKKYVRREGKDELSFLKPIFLVGYLATASWETSRDSLIYKKYKALL